MSVVGELKAGSFDAALETPDDMIAAFSASRAAVRSASLVSIHGQLSRLGRLKGTHKHQSVHSSASRAYRGPLKLRYIPPAKASY
jgi:hypothetical protein